MRLAKSIATASLAGVLVLGFAAGVFAQNAPAQQPAQKPVPKPAVATAAKPANVTATKAPSNVSAKPAVPPATASATAKQAPARSSAPGTTAKVVATKPVATRPIAGKPIFGKPVAVKTAKTAPKVASAEPAPKEAPKAAPKPEPAVGMTPSPDEAPSATDEPVGARRDPFVSLVNDRKESGGPSLPPGEAGLVVSTVRVDGTVKSGNDLIAVVSNPERHVYFIRQGDHLYDGSVVRIDLDGVTFHEESKDAFGKPVVREVTKRIYATAGEQQ